MLQTRYSNSQRSPWSGFGSLRRFPNDIERLFDSSTPTERAWLPPLEVVEANDSFVVALELPGIKAADVKVTLEDDVVTISGERKYAGVDEAERRLSERFYGRFERSVRLPSPVQAAQVKALSREGVLTITLPKTEEARPREIKIAAE